MSPTITAMHNNEVEIKDAELDGYVVNARKIYLSNVIARNCEFNAVEGIVVTAKDITDYSGVSVQTCSDGTYFSEEARCECHERDSTYVCDYCKAREKNVRKQGA